MAARDPSVRPAATRRRALWGLDAAMLLAAAAAISALALEYGFYELPAGITEAQLHVVEAVVLAVFVLNRLGHLALGPARKKFLKDNSIDFALMLVAAVIAVLVMTGRLQLRLLPAATVYVIITQVYILAALVIRTAGFQFRIAESGIPPAWTLIGSFAVVILFGAGLLMLPRAAPVEKPLSVTDAVFTATSATCVTGLIVRDTGDEFTVFGQVVILVLIQLGGLGIMIFGTLFALLAGGGLSIRQSLLAGQALSEETIGRAGRMVKFVVVATFLLEAAGAAAMYSMWRAPAGTVWGGIGRSVFHAVSAFCNAGFSLQRDSLSSLRQHWQVLGVMAPLIVLGGLGFPVLYDLAKWLWRRRGALTGSGRGAPPMALHSKLVLATSGVLLVLGAAGLLGLEYGSDPGQTYGAPYTDTQKVYGDFRPPSQPAAPIRRLPPSKPVPPIPRLPLLEGARESVFQSVTARTAGFNTVDMDRLHPASKLWMCLLMVVGGSPASTAGGMKTVTLAVLLLAIWGMLRRREQIEGFRRTIAEGFVRKALVLAGLYLSLVVLTTLLLCVAMTGERLSDGRVVSFVQLLFESCSACGTVGLSCGVTGSLTTFGKYVIIGAMFIGRLGPLTLLLALTLRVRPARYAYPSEEVILG